MKKRIVITEKSTKKRIDTLTRKQIINLFYTEYSEYFLSYSKEFKRVLTKYEDVPLEKYKLTQKDKERLSKNPFYIQLIPRYHIPKYDKIIGVRFENVLKNEFYKRFLEADTEIVKFINDTNDLYHAEIKYLMEDEQSE